MAVTKLKKPECSTAVLSISVIVPLARKEKAWGGLCSDLARLPVGSEVVFVIAAGSGSHNFTPNLDLLDHLNLKIIEAPSGRGCQMNRGVAESTGDWLWFLHADSRFNGKALDCLFDTMRAVPRSLIYFNLRFLHDGPALMWINAVGVWLRSHAFGLPFGDQGFCLPRDVFQRLGFYREGVVYGEDHLLVWEASRLGVNISCCGGALYTSARKYDDGGWFATTLNHLKLTIKQGVPQMFNRQSS